MESTNSSVASGATPVGVAHAPPMEICSLINAYSTTKHSSRGSGASPMVKDQDAKEGGVNWASLKI